MSERRLVLTLVPRRRDAGDTPVPMAIDLDGEYYEIEDLIDWINVAAEDPSNVVDFLLADGNTFSLDIDLYSRIGVEET